MLIYSARGKTTLTTATVNAPLWAFRGSTSNRCFVREIGMFYVTAPTTFGELGLQRSSALGVTPAGTVVGQPYEPGNAVSTGQVETSWGTAPTTANTYLRSFMSGAAIGNGMIWRFDDGLGLVVPLGSVATGSLVLCNLVAAAPGTMEFYVVWQE